MIVQSIGTGIILPTGMDGVPGLSFDGIAGASFEYQFEVNQREPTGTTATVSGTDHMYGAINIDRQPDPVSYDRDYVVQLWIGQTRAGSIYAKLKR